MTEKHSNVEFGSKQIEIVTNKSGLTDIKIDTQKPNPNLVQQEIYHQVIEPNSFDLQYIYGDTEINDIIITRIFVNTSKDREQLLHSNFRFKNQLLHHAT